jgi:hypothetical protein
MWGDDQSDQPGPRTPNTGRGPKRIAQPRRPRSSGPPRAIRGHRAGWCARQLPGRGALCDKTGGTAARLDRLPTRACFFLGISVCTLPNESHSRTVHGAAPETQGTIVEISWRWRRSHCDSSDLLRRCRSMRHVRGKPPRNHRRSRCTWSSRTTARPCWKALCSAREVALRFSDPRG